MPLCFVFSLHDDHLKVRRTRKNEYKVLVCTSIESFYILCKVSHDCFRRFSPLLHLPISQRTRIISSIIKYGKFTCLRPPQSTSGQLVVRIFSSGKIICGYKKHLQERKIATFIEKEQCYITIGGHWHNDHSFQNNRW